MNKITRLTYALHIEIEDVDEKSQQETLDKIRHAVDNTAHKISQENPKVHATDFGFDYQEDVSEEYNADFGFNYQEDVSEEHNV